MNKQSKIILKKKQNQLRYSLMLLLQKQFKLRFIVQTLLPKNKTYQNFLTESGPITHSKKLEPFLLTDLEMKRLTKLYTKPVYINEFLHAGAFIWNILITSLKTNSFLSEELQKREIVLAQNSQPKYISDILSFFFKKNLGYLIFNAFSKNKIRQKLLVELLRLNQMTFGVNIDYPHAIPPLKDTRFRGSQTANTVKSIVRQRLNWYKQFMYTHAKVIPLWQQDALNHINFLNLSRRLFRTRLKLYAGWPGEYALHNSGIEFFPEANEDNPDVYADYVPEDEDFMIPLLQENNNRTYFLSYQWQPSELIPVIENDADANDDATDTLSSDPILMMRKHFLTHRHDRRRRSKFTKYNTQIITRPKPNDDVWFPMKTYSRKQFFDFLKFFFYIPEDEQIRLHKFYEYRQFSTVVKDTFFFNKFYMQSTRFDDYSRNFDEVLTSTEGEDDLGLDVSVWTDIRENTALKQLVYYNTNVNVTDVDFLLKWNWKQLLTQNCMAVNENAEEFILKLMLSHQPKNYLRKRALNFLNKNFSLSFLNFTKLKKKYTNSFLKTANSSIMFDPIPLVHIETLLLRECNDFDSFFGTVKQKFYPTSNTSIVSSVDVLSSTTIPTLIGLELETFLQKKKTDQLFLEQLLNAATTFGVTNSAISHKIILNNQDQEENSPSLNKELPTGLDSNVEVTTQAFDVMSWFNWSISFLEVFANNTKFLTHPFFNKHHQILYKLFFMQILHRFAFTSNKAVSLSWEKFWTLKNTSFFFAQEFKKEICLQLFLEKVDYSEDFLRRKFSRLGTFELTELQHIYPSFMFEKSYTPQQLRSNYRLYFDNTLDLYDWSFIHFYDARWRDYIPLVPVKSRMKKTIRNRYETFSLNNWPANFFPERARFNIPNYVKSFEKPYLYSRASMSDNAEYLAKRFRSNFLFFDPENFLFQPLDREDVRYKQKLKKYFRLYLQKLNLGRPFEQYVRSLPKTVRQDFLHQQLTYGRTVDWLRFPEMFNYQFVQDEQSPFHSFFSGSNFTHLEYNVDLNSFEYRHQYLQNVVNQTFDLNTKHNIQVLKPKSNLSAIPLKSKYVRSFPLKRSPYSNFLVLLNKKNQTSISKWFHMDINYYTLVLFYSLFSTTNFDFQKLSYQYLNLLSLGRIDNNFTICRKLFKKQNLQQKFFFFNIDFLFNLRKKFHSHSELVNFISLLQLSSVKKSSLFYNQKFLTFLNRLYFFSDLIELFEQPLTKFWYSFFNTKEVGEFTTQKYIVQAQENYFKPSQLYSVNFLLFSLFTEKEKNLLQDFISLNVFSFISEKRAHLKALNLAILPLFSDWSYQQEILLYSTYLKQRYFDKHLILKYFQNQQINPSLNFYGKLLKSNLYYTTQVDHFCTMQSFLALMLYQYEQCQLNYDIYLYIFKLFVRVILILMGIFGWLYFSWNFLICCLVGCFLFFGLRFYINKSLVNTFSTYALSLFEVTAVISDSIQEDGLDLNKTNLKFPDSNGVFLRYSLEQSLEEVVGVSRLAYIILPPVDFLNVLNEMEENLLQHHVRMRVSYYEKNNLKKYDSQEFFQDLRYGTILNYSNVRAQLAKQKKVRENSTPFCDFIFPHESSLNSLENYSFNEIKTAKAMNLYWGMPITADTANRNPLYYVMQLSEDYKFFRVFRYKILFKWFFF